MFYSRCVAFVAFRFTIGLTASAAWRLSSNPLGGIGKVVYEIQDEVTRQLDGLVDNWCDGGDDLLAYSLPFCSIPYTFTYRQFFCSVFNTNLDADLYANETDYRWPSSVLIARSSHISTE